MTYGLKVWDVNGEAGGGVILDINDRTPRLITIVSGVVVPSGQGTSTTVSVPTATTSNIAITDSGAPAVVSSTGVVTVYGTYNGGTTKLKILQY